MKKWILILGGRSDLGIALAKQYAEKGFCITLAGRDTRPLQAIANQLQQTYSVEANAIAFDSNDLDHHALFYEQLAHKPEGVIYAIGVLGGKPETATQSDITEIAMANYVGAMSILSVISRDFKARGHGFIIGITSVAGLRGRQQNYIYGSAKAGLITYLSGLRNQLHKSNIEVLTVIPGFMRTKMTAGMKLPKILTIAPESAAKQIINAQEQRKMIIYIKPIWKWVMYIIQLIPEKLFKRLDL